LLDEAGEAFGKNHFGKINRARNIIDQILKESDETISKGELL